MAASERDRWGALWLSLPADPPPWLPGGLFLFGLIGAVVTYIVTASVENGLAATLRVTLLSVSALVAGIGLGMAAAQVRTALVAAPAYMGSVEPVGVEGWVISVDPSDRGPRLRLIVRAIEGNDAPPRYVRVAVPGAGMLTPGRAARCFAVLGPPSGAMAPGAYDFARRAFFEQLGALLASAWAVAGPLRSSRRHHGSIARCFSWRRCAGISRRPSRRLGLGVAALSRQHLFPVIAAPSTRKPTTRCAIPVWAICCQFLAFTWVSLAAWCLRR